MTAPDQLAETLKKALARRGRPHKTLRAAIKAAIIGRGDPNVRRFILVTNAALTTLWLIALIVSWYRLGRFDEVAAGVLAFNIAVLSLPAFLIGYWGYWLPLGVTLTVISLLLFFSLLIGSQFSH